jgi:hypothetical protein
MQRQDRQVARWKQKRHVSCCHASGNMGVGATSRTGGAVLSWPWHDMYGASKGGGKGGVAYSLVTRPASSHTVFWKNGSQAIDFVVQKLGSERLP